MKLRYPPIEKARLIYFIFYFYFRMPNMKKIYINDGEEIIIDKTIKKFLLGCCDCGLIHKINIQRKNKNIILKFERWTKKKA